MNPTSVRTMVAMVGLVVLSGLLLVIRSQSGGPLVGLPAPEITGTDLDDRPLRLSDYRGQVVVLSFWATRCPPCLAAIPEKQRLVERFRGQPFAFLGINVDTDRRLAQKTAHERGFPGRSWYDGVGGPIARNYAVEYLPTVVVVDPRGIVRHRDLQGSELDQAIEALLP